MAPWPRLKGVELQPSRSRVVLQLFPEPSLSLFAPPTRAISCGNPETMQLVYRKLQEVYMQPLPWPYVTPKPNLTRTFTRTRRCTSVVVVLVLFVTR